MEDVPYALTTHLGSPPPLLRHVFANHPPESQSSLVSTPPERLMTPHWGLSIKPPGLSGNASMRPWAGQGPGTMSSSTQNPPGGQPAEAPPRGSLAWMAVGGSPEFCGYRGRAPQSASLGWGSKGTVISTLPSKAPVTCDARKRPCPLLFITAPVGGRGAERAGASAGGHR